MLTILTAQIIIEINQTIPADTLEEWRKNFLVERGYSEGFKVYLTYRENNFSKT